MNPFNKLDIIGFLPPTLVNSKNDIPWGFTSMRAPDFSNTFKASSCPANAAKANAVAPSDTAFTSSPSCINSDKTGRFPHIAAAAPVPAATDEQRLNCLEDMERQAILQALSDHRYNRTETAKAPGISRRALTYKIQYLKEAGYQTDPV